MTEDKIQEVADLLHEAGEVHHVYYADVDGVDDDWATFYSEWLLRRTRLSDILGRTPVRSGLTRDLVCYDEQYQAEAPGAPWTNWYAERLIAKYA